MSGEYRCWICNAEFDTEEAKRGCEVYGIRARHNFQADESVTAPVMDPDAWEGLREMNGLVISRRFEKMTHEPTYIIRIGGRDEEILADRVYKIIRGKK